MVQTRSAASAQICSCSFSQALVACDRHCVSTSVATPTLDHGRQSVSLVVCTRRRAAGDGCRRFQACPPRNRVAQKKLKLLDVQLAVLHLLPKGNMLPKSSFELLTDMNVVQAVLPYEPL